MCVGIEMGNLCRKPKYLQGLGGHFREGTRVQTVGARFMEFTDTPAAREWYVGTVTKFSGRGNDGVCGMVTVEYDDITVCASPQQFPSNWVNVLPPGHSGHDVKVMGGSASKDGQAGGGAKTL